MKMDFTILKSFIAVAEEKSFSEAAKHLFISQQSLSKQIAKLEEELDTSLFVRSRPLVLTPDGRQFLQTAKGILQLKRQYEENSSKSLAGSHAVHVGIEHTVARAILPHVLPHYLHEHEDTYVKVSEESPEVLHKSIIYDGVDLVIGTLGSTPDNYEIVPLCQKDQLLVVPKQIMRELAGENYELVRAEFAEGADLSYFESAPFIKIPRQSSGGRALKIISEWVEHITWHLLLRHISFKTVINSFCAFACSPSSISSITSSVPAPASNSSNKIDITAFSPAPILNPE